MDGNGKVHEVDRCREGDEVPGEAIGWIVDGCFVGLPVLGTVVGTCNSPEADDVINIMFKVE